MSRRLCRTCGNHFETVLTGPDVECGMGRCPSAHGGTGKPPKTTARGKPIDDRKARSGAKHPTTGYVQQASTGFDLLDGCLPVLVVLVTLAALLGAGVAWGASSLVALVLAW